MQIKKHLTPQHQMSQPRCLYIDYVTERMKD